MSDHEITMTVDGERETVTVAARKLLVHALREQGHTAPNVGCESGKCGACTVELDGDVVKSCCLLAVQADGAEVTTVAGVEGAPEGLTATTGAAESDPSEPDFGPVQESFHQEHGLQCGYCTPGMVLTARELLAEDPEPSREEIRAGLKGNVCRCTGYTNVVDAVEDAARKLEPLETDGGRSEAAEESAGPDGGAD